MKKKEGVLHCVGVKNMRRQHNTTQNITQKDRDSQPKKNTHIDERTRRQTDICKPDAQTNTK